MNNLIKRYRYQLIDRRMKIPNVYFMAVLVFPVMWFFMISGWLNLPKLLAILGFFFLGLFFYVRAGQAFFGKKKK